MADQIEGLTRDSDVKSECRSLLNIIQALHLPREQADSLLESVNKIIKHENKRLDNLKKGAKK